MSYATDGHIGANFGATSSEQLHALGEVRAGDDNTLWIYGVAGDAVATGTCTYTTGTHAITDAAGLHTADVAIASGDYGWVRQTAKRTTTS